jgi:hypothetical protein
MITTLSFIASFLSEKVSVGADVPTAAKQATLPPWDLPSLDYFSISAGIFAPCSFQYRAAPGCMGMPNFAISSNFGPAVVQ